MIRSQFLEHLLTKYRVFNRESLEILISESLISPHTVSISKDDLDQIAEIVRAFFEMRSNPNYLHHYQNLLDLQGIKDPGNKSILMSYDFHLDPQAGPKLIEINTNASFLALGYELYEARQIPRPIPDFDFNELQQNILNELTLFSSSPILSINQPLRVAIVDETPEQQRLYAEFILFQQLFIQWGWQVSILDIQDSRLTRSNFDFIYNRHTDFYLKSESSRILNEIFKNHQICISPNPFEYFLLADKGRFLDWTHPHFFNNLNLNPATIRTIQRTLLSAKSLINENAAELWANRKKLFFKPLQSYGSKQAYKGAGISRQIFEKALSSGDFLAQEYVPAPEKSFSLPNGIEQTFKFDLRCYAYQGRIQLAIARLYQGQVTNARTVGGGFAPIVVT